MFTLGNSSDHNNNSNNRSSSKVFIADDKFSDVIVALERRGWHRSAHANSPNFRLKWRNLSNINFRLLRSDQVREDPLRSSRRVMSCTLPGQKIILRTSCNYYGPFPKFENECLGALFISFFPTDKRMPLTYPNR